MNYGTSRAFRRSYEARVKNMNSLSWYKLRNLAWAMANDRRIQGSKIQNVLLNEVIPSENENFIRRAIATLFSLTSGWRKSREIGRRIYSEWGTVSAREANSVLTENALRSQVSAINRAYPGAWMNVASLRRLLSFGGWESISPSQLPPNVYAEVAYTMRGNIHMQPVWPESGIIGGLKNIKNEAIKNSLIEKQEVPLQLQGVMSRDEYHTLLHTRVVTTQNGTTYELDNEVQLISFRSGIENSVCFNAGFWIMVPSVTSESVREWRAPLASWVEPVILSDEAFAGDGRWKKPSQQKPGTIITERPGSNTIITERPGGNNTPANGGTWWFTWVNR